MERLSDTECWNAVRSREREASFFFAVRTTGIVCRPGCSSRLPARKNVVYFEDLPSAMRAGFRPCKRCAPGDLSATAERERLIGRACGLLDAYEAESFAAVSVRLGLSRYHFSRSFRSVTGLTPGQYVSARRRERFCDELVRGRNVIDAAASAGYGSVSRMYESRALGMTPTAFRRHGAGQFVRYVHNDSSFGRTIVARSSGGVCAIDVCAFGVGSPDAESQDATLLARVRSRFSAATLNPDASARFGRAVAAAVEEVDDNRSSALFGDLRARLFCDRLRLALRDVSE